MIEKLKIGAYKKLSDDHMVMWIEVPQDILNDNKGDDLERIQNFCAVLGFVIEHKWKLTIKECQEELLHCFYPKTSFEWVNGEYEMDKQGKSYINLNMDDCELPINKN